MKLGIIGSRPQELGGFKAYTFHSKIKKQLKDKILELQPEVVYTGMFLGVEQWVAEICLKNKIPYIAAVPFRHQPNIWKPAQKNKYFYLLKRAESIFYIDRQIGYIEHKPDIYRESKLYKKADWIIARIMSEKENMIIGTMYQNQRNQFLYKCWQKVHGMSVEHSILDPEKLNWYTFKESPIFYTGNYTSCNQSISIAPKLATDDFSF